MNHHVQNSAEDLRNEAQQDDAPMRYGPRELWICALIAVLVCLLYFPVHDFRFLTFDDPLYVTRNAHVASGWTLKGLRWAFTTGETGNWHPLVWLSLMTDIELFGMNPGALHLVNVIFHLANSVLCFLVFRSMTRQTWPSAFLAILFAIHPLHVESVAWISERKDVLSTFFWLLALGAYTRYVRVPSRSGYLCVAVWFVLGLLSKAMVVTLPVTLLLLDHWPLGRLNVEGLNPRAIWRGALPRLVEKLPLFLLSMAVAVITLLSQKSQGAAATLENLAFPIRIGNAVVSGVQYLLAMTWPTRLAVFYPHPGLALPIWLVVGSGGLIISITFLVIIYGRRWPFLVTGWFWYLMTLLPVIGIIQVGAQARADRYTYIPLIGIFILLGWGGQAMVQRFTRHRWIWHVALGLTLGAFGLIAAQQIRYWKDDSSLFSHALKVTTDNAVPHEHLGHAYLAENRFREAAGEFAKGLAFQPNNLELNFGLADALDHLGRAEEALTFYQRVLQLRPHFPLADYQMAQILVRVGRPAEAIPHFLQVLKADPRDLDPDEKHGRAMANASGGNLGIILRSLHRLEEARACFETLLRTDPQNQTTYIYLGLTLSDLGKSDEAIAVLRRGLSLDPAQPVARYTLGRALLKDGKLDEASSAFREVLKLVPGNAEAIQQLKSIEAIQHTGKGTRSS